MRILHVNNVLPVEPMDGGRMRKQQHLDALADRHEVWVIGRTPDADARDALARTHPEWTLITVPEEEVPGRNPVAAAVRDLAARVAFDLVFVSGFSQWPGERAFRDSLVVLDIDSVDATVFQRMRDTDRAAASSFDIAATEALTRTVCRRADLVLTCSDVDAAQLRALAPDARIGVVANGIDARSFRGMGAVPDGPPVVTFTGFLAYWPNADAATFLMAEILPLLRARVPEVRVRLVGRVPPESVVTLARQHGVELHADVPDMRPWFETTHVLVAPIRAGSGTRLKILEAFAARRPVVSTSIGCEGLDVRDGEHLLVADTAPAFADAVARLLSDRNHADRLAMQAHDLLLARYERSALADHLRALIDTLGRRRAEPGASGRT
ncbi:MAG: glycosyltransferase [Acidobacteria bacterium]|nr:glycosyltransferase [Acidobacteriota bacterium]